ncbi:maleylpyruvate isomerase [Thermus composti]|uniref:DinB family protein n=1 Tax=Thermus composti TaxID=532059 RepID=A0ABV6Q0M4_9DEIN|nr:DinB family protein [Thermus composti]GGN00661.1 maleylpyruvate isomerase [Thermus composti]
MVRLEDYGAWEEALKALEESRKALLALLKGGDSHWLSTPIREGAWTPLMVAEHIALVEDSTARVLRRLRRMAAGENLPPVPVKPGEFKDGKPQAPEGVRPKGGLSLEEVLALLERARAFLLEEAAKADPQNPATFPHPFFGELNPLGWLRAAAYHEAHHLKALQEASR